MKNAVFTNHVTILPPHLDGREEHTKKSCAQANKKALISTLLPAGYKVQNPLHFLKPLTVKQVFDSIACAQQIRTSVERENHVGKLKTIMERACTTKDTI